MHYNIDLPSDVSIGDFGNALLKGAAGIAGSVITGGLNMLMNWFNTKKTNETNKEIAETNYKSTVDTNTTNIKNVESTNATNLAIQREINAQNERLMYEGWARDDTARTRMVQDLESAGLSKWLATGASPMSSSPVTLSSATQQAPQAQTPQMNYKADYSMMADSVLHAYQNFLTAEQTRRQNYILDKQGEIASQDLAIKQAERRIKEHDADVFDSRPDTASTDPTTLRLLSELSKTLSGKRNEEVKEVLDGLGNTADSAVSVIKKHHDEVESRRKSFIANQKTFSERMKEKKDAIEKRRQAFIAEQKQKNSLHRRGAPTGVYHFSR